MPFPGTMDTRYGYGSTVGFGSGDDYAVRLRGQHGGRLGDAEHPQQVAGRRCRGPMDAGRAAGLLWSVGNDGVQLLTAVGLKRNRKRVSQREYAGLVGLDVGGGQFGEAHCRQAVLPQGFAQQSR